MSLSFRFIGIDIGALNLVIAEGKRVVMLMNHHNEDTHTQSTILNGRYRRQSVLNRRHHDEYHLCCL